MPRARRTLIGSSPARFIAAFAALFILGYAGTSAAQTQYPARPVKLVVQLTPGGPGDIHASPEEFTALIRSDLVKCAKVVEQSGLKGE